MSADQVISEASDKLRSAIRHPPSAIRWLLAAFVILGAIYAVVTPLFEVSDELWHYPMVKRLADGQGLPVQDPADVGPWRQEGSQPPLYYSMMAAATFWIDTRDLEQVRWINPHTDNGLITEDRNNNIVIHRPDELTRWTGTALAVRVIRLLSVLLGAVTVFFTYRLALEIMPGHDRIALAAASITAFTPMFIFISASVNNDNLAVALSAATLWLLVRWLRRPPERVGWDHVALGVLLGAGALSKQSALGLWGLAGLVLAWTSLFGRRTTAERDGRLSSVGRRSSVVRRLLAELAITFALALLIAFPWYFRNFQLYGDWLGWDTFVAIVGARPQPATLLQLWGERVGFVQAYWGLFGGVSVPMPGWTYTVLNAAVGLALLGLGWGAARAIRARQVTREAVLQWGLLIAWPA
jgi:4-amino-4-deoxy-L-arabinose transferase-like glycosyltransferase